ncbi:MAG: LysR substrate-binding domain-containing protein [Desulfuromonadaceae bacterium]|nr:LysR substrate-binding domain-containing protein [Desulfuromonadaceae bacterium]
MNFNQLRVFQAAAKSLNFTRAAEELHLTQPGISKHLKELEEYYGTPLFERLGKKLSLTQAGEALLEATTAAFIVLDSAKERIDDLNNMTTGKLAIGACHTIGTYVLPDKLVQFRQRYPAIESSIEIKVEMNYSREIVEKVLNNSIELGLIGYFRPDPRLLVQTFMSETVQLIVSPSHPWGERKSAVRLSELAQQTVLLAARGSGTWRIVESLLVRKKVQLGRTIELGSSEAVKRAVAANMGVALLSRHVLSHELTDGTIKTVPISGGEPARDLYLIQHKDRYLSRAARAFVELVFE